MAAVLPTHVYTVTFILPDAPGPLIDKAELAASYFVEEGTLLLFKDTAHAVVEAYKSDLVTRIVRTEKPVVHAA